MKIIRVFPRRTKATPNDENAVVGDPGLFHTADKILVDCTFTWDKPEAERLAKAWNWIAPVEIGGAAYDDPGNQFEPGMFLKQGYVITSRGCNNNCWFCFAWKRSGKLRELEIKNGWIVQDDNLLACSEKHVLAVFEMLKQQTNPISFTGGLEAKLLTDWHVNLFLSVHLKNFYFAYDTTEDYEPLESASKLLKRAGLIRQTTHKACCYCLIGYPNDTFRAAEQRLINVQKLGFTPFAMLYKNDKGKNDLEWKRFQRAWARPAAIYGRELING